jgi:membrane-associated phospholipid phosphatase
MTVALARRRGADGHWSPALRPVQLRIAELDFRIARSLARSVPPPIARTADTLGWLCDARVLLALGGLGILCTPVGSSRRAMRFVATIGATTMLHHAMKRVISQKRPDRSIPNRLDENTGRAFDAMPSGHAMHAGAIASFFGSGPRAAALWLISGALAGTRMLTLAHWPSGVVAGFALGVLVERCCRLARSMR